MSLILGMDEAGYGPNLGPLVVTVTAWEVPGSPEEADFWSLLEPVCHADPPRGDERLHIADSKAVYTPARGLGALERSVLAACHLAELPCGDFHALWRAIADPAATETEPWFDGDPLPLPHAATAPPPDEAAARWRACCDRHGLRLRAIRSDVVLTQRFNRLTTQFGSKGEALTRISLSLLRQVWNPETDGPALVIADKHGGRNRYDILLHETLSQSADSAPLVHRLDEGREMSRYRVGRTELRFQCRAERHFPVALSSMVSKYLRELAMTLFNRFWAAHVPGLKPTKGYPTDARRFRQEIAAACERLGIPDDVLWRAR